MHSVALLEDKDVLCVSDRENAKIDCMRAGLKNKNKTGVAVITYNGIGKTFAVATKGRETNLEQKRNFRKYWASFCFLVKS